MGLEFESKRFTGFGSFICGVSLFILRELGGFAILYDKREAHAKNEKRLEI